MAQYTICYKDEDETVSERNFDSFGTLLDWLYDETQDIQFVHAIAFYVSKKTLLEERDEFHGPARWKKVEDWAFEIRLREPSQPSSPFSCLGMLLLACLPLGLLAGFLYWIGLGEIVEIFCRVVWVAITSLPGALWRTISQ